MHIHLHKTYAMPIFGYLFCLILLCCGQFTQAALPMTDASGQALPTLAPLIKTVKPAVVSISVTSSQTVNNPLLKDPFFRRYFNLPDDYQSPKRQSQSAGSGVILDAKQGTVVTNYHVIKNAEVIHIGLSDGRTMKAKLIGSDPDVDIAVLSITAENLQALPIADSDQLEVGDFAIAIGNPFGLNHTVTSGIVSALERSGLGIEGYESFIQTDASINPGNSGGALVNLRGELIGINTAILAPSGGNVGIGFAIPSNMAMNSIEQIIEYGEVRRGRLGVYIQDINAELAQAFNLGKQQKGVLITKVESDSAAEKAGLKQEDVITHIDDKPVDTAQALRNTVGLAKLGTQAKVSYIRNGKKKTTTVNIVQAKQKLAVKQSIHKSLIGASFAEVDEGLLITAIEANSNVVKTGLEVNDVLLAVNRVRLQKRTDIEQFASQKQLLVRVLRQGAIFYLLVE
jgi:Do/DeqQ family serine protease